MNRQRKPIPVFESEVEERAFWESHDSTGHVDWSKAQRIRPSNLKQSTKPISPPPLQPAPDGLASATPPQGGSDGEGQAC